MTLRVLPYLIAATCGVASGLVSAEERDFQTAKYFWGVQFEELEYRYSNDDEELGAWDGSAYYGSDELKFRWRTKGEYLADDNTLESLENHFLLQTPVSDFFDLKAGVRADTPEDENRTYGVLGIAGLAPYWFEIDADLYISNKGKASTELDLEYELLFTNRLSLSLGLDATVAFSEDRDIGVGKGLSSTELGARLRYDLVDRLFSPYIGIVNERVYGDTRKLAGEDSGEDWFAVVGAQIVF
ncbi:copper resistance protein B [Marinobacter sp. R17]|uniref:copper resistance protein B n=1 Tax=Marinobacter sp. R17 TaxID=2484250 RepID=UPI000F4C68D6|nr:copper resistance protein B [Marinobacter sp. R17]ROU00462.1 copper resistance protein B [Marinobacter sp. R17]